MSQTSKDDFKQYISAEENIPEFTWFPIVMGQPLFVISDYLNH